MTSYCYEAVDAVGSKKQGVLEVCDQMEALRRIREMGLFPVKVAQKRGKDLRRIVAPSRAGAGGKSILQISLFQPKPKAKVLAVFTRQLATLINAGMPLLRGLKTLEEQEEHAGMKVILGRLADSIEGGSTLTEAMANYPKVFSPLYLNMVRAGELSGALEITLRRLAEFMEKAQRIKGKIKAAMFYPCAVMFVAIAILAVLLVFVIPRFREVFDGMMNGASMPKFTLFVLAISETVKNHALAVTAGLAVLAIAFAASLRTRLGRMAFDRFKLVMPLLGPIFRKVAIARFSRTFGTLLNSGVPMLQALNIVRETAGNVVVGGVISDIHNGVKEGETVSGRLKASGIFPAMVAGMVDVGEQTGALPDMLMKVADTYDEEVDNAVSSMTSLLEPIMIVFLAVVVGSIVIAMFLPIIYMINGGGMDRNGEME